jgi:hypothetical protein
MEQITSAPLIEAASAEAVEHQSNPPPPVDGRAIYFNGFSVAIAVGDVAIPIYRNGMHFATLNVSYSIAKSLAESLTTLIAQLEKATGNHIMTVDEVHKAVKSTE